MHGTILWALAGWGLRQNKNEKADWTSVPTYVCFLISDTLWPTVPHSWSRGDCTPSNWLAQQTLLHLSCFLSDSWSQQWEKWYTFPMQLLRWQLKHFYPYDHSHNTNTWSAFSWSTTSFSIRASTSCDFCRSTGSKAERSSFILSTNMFVSNSLLRPFFTRSRA